MHTRNNALSHKIVIILHNDYICNISGPDVGGKLHAHILTSRKYMNDVHYLCLIIGIAIWSKPRVESRPITKACYWKKN